MATTSQRNLGIDILRATAILMVFFGHGVTLTRIPIAAQLGTAVDLFFVISGFLIGRIYFRNRLRKTFTVLGFWKARWWRTLPPYLVALAMYAAGSRWLVKADVSWRYVTLTQNYGRIVGFGPSWSLCVEEHFYLLLPLLAMLCERLVGLKRMLWVLPVAFFVPLLLRIGTVMMLGGFPRDWYWMTHLHCEGMVAGVWMAYLYVHRPEIFAAMKPWCMWLLPLLPVTLFVLSVWNGRTDAQNVWVFWLLAIGYTAWFRVVHDVQWEPKSAAGASGVKVMRLIAIASYSIYLMHVLFLDLIRVAIDRWPRGVAKSSTILTGTFVACMLFYFVVERTTLLLRDRWMTRENAVHSDLTIGQEIIGR